MSITGCKFDLGTQDKVQVINASENYGRSSWQKPNLVIDQLGDLSNKVVADIGAGVGFFSFRLASKAKKVIAIDIDKNMIDIINLQKQNFPAEVTTRLITRLVSPTNPKLQPNEVDKILIINTIAFIDNRTSYLTKLYQSLRDSGEIMIVDFKMDDLPIEAPSKNNRLFTRNIIADLEKSGFKEIEVDEILLDYQYIVKGRKLGN
jgi:2-polyprenyl-3-methyl-5-hydroxy-6-metoxy-1,4-benzoquinol methylase